MDNRSGDRPMSSPKTLRELRLWHWRKVMTFRKAATGYEQRGMTRAAKAQHTNANWHLGVVRLLNEQFPIGDYAEHDDV